METSQISNLIVNSVALAFVLSIDEMLCEMLMSPVTRTLLAAVDELPLHGHVSQEVDVGMSDAEVLERHEAKHSWNRVTWQDLTILVPWKFVSTICLTFFFVAHYYWRHCVQYD